MKMGSWHNTTIDWPKGRAGSAHILFWNRRRRLKVLRFLLLWPAQEGGGGERFALALWHSPAFWTVGGRSSGPTRGSKGEPGPSECVQTECLQRAAQHAGCPLSFNAARRWTSILPGSPVANSNVAVCATACPATVKSLQQILGQTAHRFAPSKIISSASKSAAENAETLRLQIPAKTSRSELGIVPVSLTLDPGTNACLPAKSC